MGFGVGWVKTLGLNKHDHLRQMTTWNTFSKDEICMFCVWFLLESWKFHDDVIKWKHFPRNWPFGPRWNPRTQRPVTRSFDVSFDLRLNKRLSKQSWGWWFETLSRPLWRHCNVLIPILHVVWLLNTLRQERLFCRRHFQMHFHEWRCLHFYSNLLKSVTVGLVHNMSSLIFLIV